MTTTEPATSVTLADLQAADLGLVLLSSSRQVLSANPWIRRLALDRLGQPVDEAVARWSPGIIEAARDVWLDITDVPVSDGSTLWLVADVSARENERLARERHDAELEQENALLSQLSQLQGSLLTTGDELGVYSDLLSTALAMTDSEFGFLAEVFQDPRTGDPYMLSRAITDIAWDAESELAFERARTTGLRFDNLQSLFGHVLTTHEVVVSNDPPRDPRSGGLPAGHPQLRAFLGLPVCVDGELIGCIGLANRPEGYPPEIVEFMAPFIGACGTLLWHSRAERARRRAEEELRTSRTRAESASEAKNVFLSRMSHEIRTPLNAMLGFAQLIQIRAADDKDRRDAGRMVSAGRHLMTLLDEVMDMSSIEEGRIPLDLVPVSLVSFVSECMTIIEGAAAERSITMSLTVDTDLLESSSITVHVDPARLRQVILNLLDNAVKYNRHGGSVRVRIEAVDSTALVDVEDEGRGIGEDGRDRVFDAFERLDAASIGVRGSGLGLSVARSLARAMAGDVNLASSRPGRTVFRLVLPLIDAVTQAAQAPEPLAPRPEIVGEVLYIEDNATNAVLVRSVLEHLLPSVRLSLARNGREALRLLARSAPDVVLLDLHLPDMQGLELLRLARLDSDLPVHVVTADVTAQARRALEEHGVDGVLLKPVTPRDLVACVISGLARRSGHAGASMSRETR